MKPIAALLFILLLFSCTEQKKHPYTFYYWKTHLALDETEKAALEIADSPYLYTRFFDVDKIGGRFQPVATLTKDFKFVTDKDIVPVVFITNRTFLNIKPNEISFLANSIKNLVEQKTRDLKISPSNEIQIDCDWTAGTRDDFFKFLKELRRISKKNITSTLRLHQVKDREKMGVPPVSKVYLMCYSTSSPLENSNKNSILDVQLLKNYLSKIDSYPIKEMDVALPIYSWGIVTNHLGKRKLINAITVKDLENPDFKRISHHEVLVQKDGFYFGNYLNKGFKIKVEEITENELKDVTSFLDRKISNYNIVYYQLHTKFVENHDLNRTYK